MTLVELLIVIGIMVLLASAALTMARPALRDRKVREASRELNGYLSMAQAMAKERGRPVGVWLERSDLDNYVCTQLYVAEVQTPYSGDVQNAEVTVADYLHWNPAVTPPATDGIPDTLLFTGNNCPSMPFIVQVGDLLRIDGHNTLYVIDGVFPAALPTYPYPRVTFYNPTAPIVMVNGTPLLASNGKTRPAYHPGNDGRFGIAGTDDDGNGQVDDVGDSGYPGSDDVPVGTNYPSLGASVRFQVLRQPRKSLAKPLTLPDGVVVDLFHSGMGLTGLGIGKTPYGVGFGAVAKDYTPVVIMFSPNGNLDRIYMGVPDASAAGFKRDVLAVTSTIHLLVGTIEGSLDPSLLSPLDASAASPTPSPFNRNLSDNSTLWVSINHQTGLVTSAENGWRLDTDNSTTHPLPTLVGSLARSREFAQTAQSMGGR